MCPSANPAVRKRPVNLTLSENLLSEARLVTDNLSAVVESLLVDFVARKKAEQIDKARVVATAVSAWNAFNEATGSIADEYSSL